MEKRIGLYLSGNSDARQRVEKLLAARQSAGERDVLDASSADLGADALLSLLDLPEREANEKVRRSLQSTPEVRDYHRGRVYYVYKEGVTLTCEDNRITHITVKILEGPRRTTMEQLWMIGGRGTAISPKVRRAAVRARVRGQPRRYQRKLGTPEGSLNNVMDRFTKYGVEINVIYANEYKN